MKGAVVIIQGCDLHQVWQIFLNNRALCLVWLKHSTGVNSKWGFSKTTWYMEFQPQSISMAET